MTDTGISLKELAEVIDERQLIYLNYLYLSKRAQENEMRLPKHLALLHSAVTLCVRVGNQEMEQM